MEAAAELCKEGVCVRTLLEDDFGVYVAGPSTLFTDSKSGKDMIENAGITKRSVHFERRLHYRRVAGAG